jgi:hypothetical protein
MLSEMQRTYCVLRASLDCGISFCICWNEAIPCWLIESSEIRMNCLRPRGDVAQAASAAATAKTARRRMDEVLGIPA